MKGRLWPAAVLVFSAPLVAQSPRRTVSLEDFYRLSTVSAAVVAPDGGRVAIVRTVVDEAQNQRRSEVWLAPSDGAAPATLLSGPGTSSTGPIWSPDGKLLAVTSRRGATDESGIWFFQLDRPGEPFQIPGLGGTPVFSPDNQWIAFTKPVPQPPKRSPESLSEFDRKLKERFTGKVHESVQYRFDGRGYISDPTDSVATPARELFVVARSGGEPRQLTHLGVTVERAAWSPDSRSIILTANASQRDEYTYERSDLWLLSLDGAIKRLTDDGYHHSDPVWSPDGSRIAFVRHKGLSLVIQGRETQGAPVDLYTMQSTGGALRNLTAEWDLIPDDVEWSADGRFVYFGAETGGDRHLFRVSGLGGAVEQVSKGARRLEAITLAPSAGRIAYTSTDPTHPAEAYSARIDGSGEVKLSGFNDAWREAVSLSAAERLQYNSKDGTRVEGWLMLPRGAGRHGLILSIHGGPHGAYGTDFSLPFQLLVAQGYAVLFTNPRGSTGYGEKFLWATWGGWGIKDQDDVMSGVDYVVGHYPIDRERLGVSGYSYGGFLTDWLITQTRIFKAAVSGAGISNWVSDYGTADIPRTKESEFFGPPWEERGRETLINQSPIFRAKGVTTPTLFIQGEADYRVPAEQAEQMYTALRKQRVPARMVRYPGMSHGGWSPWNTVHRYNEELNWWRRYLGGSVVP
ncbi:MAG: S9 family peptidase [Gemmatimonadota bacterium]